MEAMRLLVLALVATFVAAQQVALIPATVEGGVQIVGGHNGLNADCSGAPNGCPSASPAAAAASSEPDPSKLSVSPHMYGRVTVNGPCTCVNLQVCPCRVGVYRQPVAVVATADVVPTTATVLAETKEEVTPVMPPDNSRVMRPVAELQAEMESRPTPSCVDCPQQPAVTEAPIDPKKLTVDPVFHPETKIESPGFSTSLSCGCLQLAVCPCRAAFLEQQGRVTPVTPPGNEMVPVAELQQKVYATGPSSCVDCPAQVEAPEPIDPHKLSVSPVKTARVVVQGSCPCVLQPVCACRAATVQPLPRFAEQLCGCSVCPCPAQCGCSVCPCQAALWTTPEFKPEPMCGCLANGPACPCWVKPTVSDVCRCIGQPSCPCWVQPEIKDAPSTGLYVSPLTGR